MKRILSVVIVAALLVIIHSKTVVAQDPKTPHKNKTERQIKIVKVDDDGNKTSIDTVITGNAPFVWEGDTVYVSLTINMAAKRLTRIWIDARFASWAIG